MIRIGPAGNSESFTAMGYKSTPQIPEYLEKMGLNAYEYQCGRGVRINREGVLKLKAGCEARDIQLSLHAPYYISLSSVEEEKRQNSIKYILESAEAADLMGATRIISMSRHADRQRIAREFGATDFVEERGDEAVAKVLEMTDGYGADAVLECVGSALSNDTAMKVARAGAVVGRVGLPHGVEADIPGLFYRNVGLRGGPAPVRTYDLQRLLKEVLDGNINPGIVYTSEYTLDDIQEAYAAMDERRTVKSLLRISEV